MRRILQSFSQLGKVSPLATVYVKDVNHRHLRRSRTVRKGRHAGSRSIRWQASCAMETRHARGRAGKATMRIQRSTVMAEQQIPVERLNPELIDPETEANETRKART